MQVATPMRSSVSFHLGEDAGKSQFDDMEEDNSGPIDLVRYLNHPQAEAQV